MEPNQALLLFIIALAALVLPWVSRNLHLPAPVLEISFGILLGKSFLQLEFEGTWLPFLAELGFLILMFQSGMEIDFNSLKQLGRKNLVIQFLFFASTVILAVGCCLWLEMNLFLALVLSTTSLGLVMPTLREAGISRTHFGQTILVAATLADFLTLLGITLYVLYITQGFSWRFFSPVPLFAGFGLLIWAGRLWVWWHPEKAERFLGADDSQEIGVRLSLAFLFLFVAISEYSHIEPVLGAFLGGCVLSFIFRKKTILEEKMGALGFGFLVPVFFIHVGMGFDLQSIINPSHLLLAGQLLIYALVVKIIPSLWFTAQGFALRNALRSGILLSTRLSLIVAAASIGLQAGLLTPQVKDTIILLAVLTCFIGPTIFKMTHRMNESA